MFFFISKCPLCRQKGQKVNANAMLHHVKDISKISDSNYFYCKTPSCDIVYYNDKETFTSAMINKEIGCKDSSSQNALICYCYNYTKSSLDTIGLVDKIQIRIDSYGSRCDTRHPSGQCCLPYIKNTIKERATKKAQREEEKKRELLQKKIILEEK